MEISKDTVVSPGIKLGYVGALLGMIQAFLDIFQGNIGIGTFLGIFIVTLILAPLLGIVGQFIRTIIDPLVPDLIFNTFWKIVFLKFLLGYGFPIIGGIVGSGIALMLFTA